MKPFRILLFCILCPLLFAYGCNKLDVKPRQSLVVPQTLEDFQGMMDNDQVLNAGFCALGEIAADNYYVLPSTYDGLAAIQHKKAYTWADDIFSGITFEADWNSSYDNVFYCNVVLEGLNHLKQTARTDEYNNVKGQALFHRANAFFMLSQVFAAPYVIGEEGNAPGIPLRLTSDVNKPATINSLRETYDQILGDLRQSAILLPDEAVYKTRPTKSAAYGLLARVYLSIENYENAFRYADSCLALYNTLMDFNDLDSTQDFPISQFNPEVIFHATFAVAILRSGRAITDSLLYQSYMPWDLRRNIFFTENADHSPSFSGNYNGASTVSYFAGIATDEIWLTRAECNARLGRAGEARKDLNALLEKRYRTGAPLVNADKEEAILSLILAERRKELLLRGLRWTDLRRLNRDSRYATTIKRVLGTKQYTLAPNDPKYVYPIPDYVKELGSL